MTKTINILLIDDSERIIELVKAACRKLKYEFTAYEPTYDEKDEALKEFNELVATKVFDLALVDYELWQEFTGKTFTPSLKAAKIPFVAFSTIYTNNKALIDVGAYASIPKGVLHSVDDVVGALKRVVIQKSLKEARLL